MHHADGLLVQIVELPIIIRHVPRLLLSFLSYLLIPVNLIPMRAIMIILMIIPFHNLILAIQIPLRAVFHVILLDLPILHPKVIKPVEFLELDIGSLQVYLVKFHSEQLIENALKVVGLDQQKISPLRKIVHLFYVEVSLTTELKPFLPYRILFPS